MNFSEALELLRAGKMVTRIGWNGKGMHIKAQFPNTDSENTLPYIFILTADGQRVPWVASHTDLFATDWAEFLFR